MDMRPNINKLIGENKRNKKELSKKVKKILISYALEAHKLDKSKTISYYYEFYVNYLREKWLQMEVNERQKFFTNEIIET